MMVVIASLLVKYGFSLDLRVTLGEKTSMDNSEFCLVMIQRTSHLNRWFCFDFALLISSSSIRLVLFIELNLVGGV